MPDRAAPAGGVPANEKVKITPEMIEAGASALLDGSDLTADFSQQDARYFSERVLRAVLDLIVR